jgi:Protein of unknwon function (DUF3310)
MSSLDTQEGGDHYRRYPIQPVEYTVKNGLGFLAGNVIKYVTRYKDKGGAEDIRKAIHYLNLILEFEYPKSTAPLPLISSGWAKGDCPIQPGGILIITDDNA